MYIGHGVYLISVSLEYYSKILTRDPYVKRYKNFVGVSIKQVNNIVT